MSTRYKTEERRNSILIVSASEQFDAQVGQSISDKGFVLIDKRKTATLARRALMDKNYDIVIINAPLSDEMGYELALDICEDYNTSVLIATPPEIFDSVSDYVSDAGVLVTLKPLQTDQVGIALRYLLAVQNRIHRFEEQVAKTEEKLEEVKLVSRAKILLMEKKHMSEKDAHRLIGKEAMDHGVSRKTVASSIIDSLE